MNTIGSIAVLVRTPGFSPIKARLAKSIGKIPSETFYQLSAKALEVTLQGLPEQAPDLLMPYWAVEEAEALDCWKTFSVFHQGVGDTGQKISQVYSTLLEKHPYVLLIRADIPHLSLETVIQAAQRIKDTGEFVLGPSEDGGYYLFGGSKPIPEPVWRAVPYGTRDTFKVLSRFLSNIGTLHTLAPLFDIDTEEDLERLELEFATLRHHLGAHALNPEQKLLLNWINKLSLNQ